MHRNLLKKLLENYSPIYPNEQTTKKLMLDFLATCEDCFSRSCGLGHFTASALLLNSDCSRILLLHHKKLGKWFQPGGHCDGDSDVLRVAIKEAREESGIDNIIPLQESIFDIDMHLIPQLGQESPHYHFDICFLLKTNGNDEVKINYESTSLKWFEPDEKTLPTSDESVLRMLEKWNALVSVEAYGVQR
jgi:8-oxo-dGTP pyrophosphatase MutT (NUDIX family)